MLLPKILLASIVLVYILQNSIFYYVKSSYDRETQPAQAAAQANGLITLQDLKGVLLEEEASRREAHQELWNCVTLYLGGNISPSLTQKQEYWRLISCFFLHENFFHMIFNALIIYSYFCTLNIKQNEFVPFLILTVINGNLTSALAYPDFLKIGSSVLTFVLFTFNLAQNWKVWQAEKAIDICMVLFLVFSIGNGRLDNAVHYFGVLSSLGFIYAKRKNQLTLYYFLAAVYFAGVATCLLKRSITQEEQFAVELDYGCSYVWNKFQEAIN
jgi:membrane associated rhomboid family serine protease